MSRLNLLLRAPTSLVDLAAQLGRLLARLAEWVADQPLRAYVRGYSAAASTPFVLAHSLGVKPTLFLPLLTQNTSIWATEADMNLWSATQIVLRCSGTNQLILGEVVAHKETE